MWWVDGFVCPELLHDIHPLHLTLFLSLVEFDKQYEKGGMCGVFLIDTEYSVIEDTWYVWAAHSFLCYSHGATPLGWGTHRN